MNDEQTKLITQLAEKLGTTVEHLWSVLVKQAPIEATVDLAVSSLALATTIYIFRKAVYAKTEEYGGVVFGELKTDVPKEVFVFLSGLGLVVVCIFFFITLTHFPVAIFNPEYWAFKQIVK